ncbi:Leucine Rich Repeat family protein [Histomonas meleagridis]|uniref:Leucine Rich Repeat family protein n=1 Tax=Histomonas meleagridis TaxID=135588 RepID=UPI00355ABE18|nr:Leucine Rich Repeat family protein [Histomonas meleagridis]KAH0804896.1 Leucine Rich Repeat family protein [Histomonas meleagridis]
MSPLITYTKYLQLIDIHNCQVEVGINELAEALTKNPENKIVYWDLSNNPFKNITPFCKALSLATAPIFYLNLSTTQLTTESTIELFNSILNNKNLWGIKYLFIDGAIFSEESLLALSKLISTFAQEKIRSLHTLSIANIKGQIETVINVFNRWPQPISSFNVSNNELNQKAISELNKFVKGSESLKDLDISSTNLSSDDITDIINGISENQKITEMKLNLAKLELTGKKIRDVMNAFENSTLTKWTGISIESNDVQMEELGKFISVARRMTNLRSLSLGDNFTYKTKGIEEALLQILSLNSLRLLSIRGTEKRFLGDKLYRFLKAMKINTTLLKLDISGNKIKDTGMDLVCDVLRSNKMLTELNIDGSCPKNQKTLLKFFETLSSNTYIVECAFPYEDFSTLLSSISSNSQMQSFFDQFSKIQKSSQEAIQKNQMEVGAHSYLSEKKLPELDELIDNITINVHQKLENTKFNQHAAISSVFGLPLPHLDPSDDQTKGAIIDLKQPQSIDEYELKNTNVMVVEDISMLETPLGLKTLQYNSLCIRRSIHVEPKIDVNKLDPTEEEIYRNARKLGIPPILLQGNMNMSSLGIQSLAKSNDVEKNPKRKKRITKKVVSKKKKVVTRKKIRRKNNETNNVEQCEDSLAMSESDEEESEEESEEETSQNESNSLKVEETSEKEKSNSLEVEETSKEEKSNSLEVEERSNSLEVEETSEEERSNSLEVEETSKEERSNSLEVEETSETTKESRKSDSETNTTKSDDKTDKSDAQSSTRKSDSGTDKSDNESKTYKSDTQSSTEDSENESSSTKSDSESKTERTESYSRSDTSSKSEDETSDNSASDSEQSNEEETSSSRSREYYTNSDST